MPKVQVFINILLTLLNKVVLLFEDITEAPLCLILSPETVKICWQLIAHRILKTTDRFTIKDVKNHQFELAMTTRNTSK